MKGFANRSRGATGARGGFTLIELAIATSILLIGIVSVLSASSRMHSLRQTNREHTLAQNAMRSMAERIHASSHGFSDEPATWAARLLATYQPGGDFGDSFEVEGLAQAAGASRTGLIQITFDETDSDTGLGVDLAMPRDLNGDGDADDADVSADARLLPVILTLRWRGVNGPRVMRHGFYVVGY